MKNLTTSILVALCLFGCGGSLKYDVPSAGLAPGADAKIVANVKEHEHNTMLQMDARNLPPPERVGDGATAYVAWYRKDDKATWTKLGVLEYEQADRQGKLEASAPETKFELIVSAEKGGETVSPSPKVVFQQRIGKE